MSVLLQWTTVGDVDIDIGANPSAEEADEGVESTDRKTVDIIESFRLNVRTPSNRPPQSYLTTPVCLSAWFVHSHRDYLPVREEEYLPYCGGRVKGSEF